MAGVRSGFTHIIKTDRQALICVSGSGKVHLDNAKRTEEVELVSYNIILILGPNDWHEMYDFSLDCVFLVLASLYMIRKIIFVTIINL